MTNLTISDITWDGFTASWTPAGGEFDSFVIEITNLENLEESQNLTLSGGAFSLTVSGLNPNTSYMVGLFGVYQDAIIEPVYAEAATGTRSRQRCSRLPSGFLSFLSIISSVCVYTPWNLCSAAHCEGPCMDQTSTVTNNLENISASF